MPMRRKPAGRAFACLRRRALERNASAAGTIVRTSGSIRRIRNYVVAAFPICSVPGSSVVMHRLASIAVWLRIVAGVVVLDQATKALVENTLPFGASVFVVPVLDLVHVRNIGAAFSFLAGASGWQRELFIGIACAASIWIIWMLVCAE